MALKEVGKFFSRASGAIAIAFAISGQVHAEATMPVSALECTPEGMAAFFQLDGQKLAEAKVNASGYGAPPKNFYPEPQRRLMAMRASQVDAYRNLAERVNGLHIWGGTTVGDMVVEKDRYRVFLDSYLRGAKVMAAHPVEDGTYETVVELLLDQAFLRAALGLRPCSETLSASLPVPTPTTGMAQEHALTQPVVNVAPTAPVMPATTPSKSTASPVSTPAPAATVPPTSSAPAEGPRGAETAKKSGKNSLYFSEDE